MHIAEIIPATRREIHHLRRRGERPIGLGITPPAAWPCETCGKPGERRGWFGPVLCDHHNDLEYWADECRRERGEDG